MIITSSGAQLQVPLRNNSVDDYDSNREYPSLSLICCLFTFPFSTWEWEQHGWWPLLSSATDSFPSPCWFCIDQWAETDLFKFCFSKMNPDVCSDVFKECRTLPSGFLHTAWWSYLSQNTSRPFAQCPVVPLCKNSSSKAAQNQSCGLTRNINAKVRFRNIILTLHMQDFRTESLRFLASLQW